MCSENPPFTGSAQQVLGTPKLYIGLNSVASVFDHKHGCAALIYELQTVFSGLIKTMHWHYTVYLSSR